MCTHKKGTAKKVPKGEANHSSAKSPGKKKKNDDTKKKAPGSQQMPSDQQTTDKKDQSGTEMKSSNPEKTGEKTTNDKTQQSPSKPNLPPRPPAPVPPPAKEEDSCYGFGAELLDQVFDKDPVLDHSTAEKLKLAA